MNPHQSTIPAIATHAPYVYISTREGLNVLIGKPATNIWQTSVTGYDVTLWQYSKAYQTHVPERSVFVPRRGDADKVAARWRKQSALRAAQS